MIRRIVLVKPPEESEFSFGAFSLSVLAAAVAERAEVSIVDATRLPVGDAVEEVWRRGPDLVGVTTMGTASVAPVTAFVRRLRAAQSGRQVVLVAGGHGATWAAADLLASGVDAVVLGEGERTFQQMVAHGIQPGAPGTACLQAGELVIGPPQALIEPLDRLPWPARELMPPPPDGMHLMETSRGCPHACTFCATTRFHGRRWRPKSAGRVVAEIRTLVDEHKAWIIHLADDNFAASPRRVRDICEALRGQPLPLFFVVSARADDLLRDPDLLPAMALARMMRVSVGVETLDFATATQVGKPITRDAFQVAFRCMRELGIFSIASLIVGLPGENPAYRQQMVEHAVQCGPDSALFLPYLRRPEFDVRSGSGLPHRDRADVRDAERFSRAFALHPTVRARLEAAAAEPGVRGLLAEATLEKQRAMYGPE
jgi:anaerobic magnesium-protoporphyrin IX monomethyl ester cyclase